MAPSSTDAKPLASSLQQTREWRHAEHFTAWICDFGGGGGGRLRLDGPLEFIGSAFAQSNPALLEKGFVKFKVGDVEVTQIYDGIWNRELQDGFVKNAALADVQAALKAAGLAENIVPIPFTVTAVTIGGKTTLIDSGTGAPGQVQPTAGLASCKKIWPRRASTPARSRISSSRTSTATTSPG